MVGRRALTATLAALLLFGFAGQSQAHTASYWFSAIWAENKANIRVIWGQDWFRNNDAFRARIVNALEGWDALGQGTNFTWPGYNNTLDPWNPCSNGENRNGIFHFNYADGDGDSLARTQLCYEYYPQFTRVWSFVIRFDAESWHTGTDTPPVGSWDLWGAAAHEAGHAMGGWMANHWDEGALRDVSLCPSSTSRHTMCSSLYGRGRYARSLEYHERETFGKAY